MIHLGNVETTKFKVYVDINDDPRSVELRCSAADYYTALYSHKYVESNFDKEVVRIAYQRESECMKLTERSNMLIFTPYVKARINSKDDVIFIEDWCKPYNIDGVDYIEGHIKIHGHQFAIGTFPIPCYNQVIEVEALPER